MKFDELDLDRRLLKSLQHNGLTEPMPIQRAAIPPALEMQDVIGIAPTGSGKTLAYALPTLHWVYNAKVKHSNPTVLILVPTRELVKQVDKVILELSRYTEIFTARVYAGPREGKQIRSIEDEEFIDVIIATPGRLINFLEEGIVDLSNISILVLDEVDTLLDMGFLPDIQTILSYVPHRNARQTLLFGATLPKDVEYLAKELQKDPKIIDLGRASPPESIDHAVFEANEDEKYDVLVELLHRDEIEKVIIFTQSKHEARITARNLRRDGLPLEEIHGGLTQRQRSHALDNFRSGQVNCLVASDVAARGLDIPDVTHIISYDVPNDFTWYVHRAGRTGRAFRQGTSWIIASPKEFANLRNIDEKLGFVVPRERTLHSRRNSTNSRYIDSVVAKRRRK